MEPSKTLGRLFNIFNIKTGNKQDTSVFQGVSHDILCEALCYWIDQSRLILVEPINVNITQNLRDDGVDVILDFPMSHVKIGFQVKSHFDIGQADFSQKVKAQIASSRKYGLNKLLVCLCGNLNNKTQFERMNGISTEISEMNKLDEYVYVLSPLKMVNILDAFNEKKHPLRYSTNLSSVVKSFNAILEALSEDPEFVPSLSFKMERREKLDEAERPFKFSLALKDDAFENMTLIDKIREAQYTGEAFRIPADKIEKLVLNDEVMPFTSSGFIEIKPELPTLPPSSIYIEEADGKRTKYYENVVFSRRAYGGVVNLTSNIYDNITFNILINTTEKKISIGLHVDTTKLNAKQLYNYFKFYQEIVKGKKLVFTNEHGEMDGTVSIDQPDIIDDFWMGIIEKLSFIQEKAGIGINISRELSKDDVGAIEPLYELLSVGETRSIIIEPTISYKKKDFMPLVDSYKKLGFLKDIKTDIRGFQVNFLDYNVVIGDVTYEIDKMVIEGFKDIETKLSTLGLDDVISIQLKRMPDSNYRLYVKNYSIQASKRK